MERFELAKRKPTLEHLSIFPLTGAEVEDLMRALGQSQDSTAAVLGGAGRLFGFCPSQVNFIANV
jgi:hypothetical protein